MGKKEDLQWSKKQEEDLETGMMMVRKAHDDALDFMTDAIENMNDRAWRKMVVESQSKEMGVGLALMDVVARTYEDMGKRLHKKIKVPKKTGDMLRNIYIGRLVKALRKELNEQ